MIRISHLKIINNKDYACQVGSKSGYKIIAAATELVVNLNLVFERFI